MCNKIFPLIMSVRFTNPGGVKKIVNVYVLKCEGGEKLQV